MTAQSLARHEELVTLLTRDVSSLLVHAHVIGEARLDVTHVVAQCAAEDAHVFLQLLAVTIEQVRCV